MRDHAGRPLRLAALALFVIAGAAFGLIAAGAFDPRPFGPLVNTSVPGSHTQEERGERFIAQADPFGDRAPDRFSVRLTATHVAGERDSGYGLAVGDPAAALVVAVSPLGEVAIWETASGGAPVYALPWQPWPHVQQDAANEIWLDVEQEPGRARVSVRVNREHLWQGDVGPLEGRASLWLGSFGSAARIDFQRLEWFAPGKE